MEATATATPNYQMILFEFGRLVETYRNAQKAVQKARGNRGIAARMKLGTTEARLDAALTRILSMERPALFANTPEPTPASPRVGVPDTDTQEGD